MSDLKLTSEVTALLNTITPIDIDRLADFTSALENVVDSEVVRVLRGQANEVDHNWADQTAAEIALMLRELADAIEMEMTS